MTGHPTDAPRDGEPSAATLLAYALPALPLAVLTLPFYVLVPSYYTERLGLPIAAVGQALLLVRIIDALSDPVTGVLADRFHPGFGRRRLWLLLATPLIALAAWQVFVPPAGAGIPHLALWATVLSIAWTAAQVPYLAWGSELSRSYAGRNRVSAFREGLTVAGTLIALSLPALLPALGVAGEPAVMTAFAVIVGVGLPIAAAVTVWRVPEPVERSQRRLPLRESLRHVAANGPFRRLLLAFFVNGFANGLPATLFLFFVSRRLEAPDATGPLLVLYFVAGLAGLPLWLWLARRFGKHRTWALGMLTACAAFAVAPFLGPGQVWIFAGVTLVTGLALGADVVLPTSLQADVIDVDTASSGEERAALYVSLWALATKLALAGAVGLAFPVLSWAGFDPGAKVATPGGLLALALLYAGLPVLLKIVAVALVWSFPLDAETQAGLRAKIEGRTDRPSAR